MFYVYELRDPRTDIAFYVGKGQGDRAYQHQREVVNGTAKSNPAKIKKILDILNAGYQVDVFFVAEYENEEDALDHEFRLVDSNHTLTNVCPGGGGKIPSELYLLSCKLKRIGRLWDNLSKIHNRMIRKHDRIKYMKKFDFLELVVTTNELEQKERFNKLTIRIGIVADLYRKTRARLLECRRKKQHNRAVCDLPK